MLKELLIVFARTPELGKVKTRIANVIGDAAALEIYIQLLAYTHQLLLTINKHAIVLLTNLPATIFWEGIEQAEQIGNDLGERITNACNTLSTNKPTHTVIIGTDCLELTKEIIDEAFIQLHTYDLVIGPAKDGGYYLIGFQQFHASLFEKITWGTATVYAETIAIAKQLNLSIYNLPVLNDVDEVTDLPAEWLNPS